MNIKTIGRIALAVIVGEIALILGTTLVQEVLFDGISFVDSTSFVLIFGGLLTVFAAILAGYAARKCFDKHLSIPALISLIIGAETYYLITAGVTQGPLWFDIFAGLSLIVGIWLGYMIKNHSARSQMMQA